MKKRLDSLRPSRVLVPPFLGSNPSAPANKQAKHFNALCNRQLLLIPATEAGNYEKFSRSVRQAFRLFRHAIDTLDLCNYERRGLNEILARALRFPP